MTKLWDNLMDIGKGYVKDDAIVLNVEIEAADPNEINQTHMLCANVDKCCDELCWSTHRLTIGNISNLMAVRSQQFQIRNLPFRFIVLKDGMKNLGFDLHSEWNSNASCKIQMTVKLISSRADKKIEQVRNRTIPSFGVLGVSNIISWKELTLPQNGFIQNDVIFIEVDIKASRPDGFHPNDERNSTPDVKRAKMECPICFESFHQKKISFVPCGHIFCTACITKVIETNNKCPTCSKMVKLDEVRLAYLPISEWV
ncbi:ubiquitin carboxyl-terminal hydrolase 7-like [Bradysia coprophila]|uniref:ubiquitin carboxyl-terminal hydrolase 7-like n=1 Tax=Bradysia coprophila TaxID=38358 RepID=UPI00187D7624|nr:ubiquitin carboxyl-terminal hydrolase 7-like [Bradysia coprophila]